MREIEPVRNMYDRLREEVGHVIVGQDEVVEQLLISIFCRGHSIVVGVPGLAKTLLISTVAGSLSLKFSRIQFTPDLMPSDITGTEVIEEDKASGTRSLRFVKGPVFANVILADEINRTPPKTQAALLEAMQEHQVTASGSAHHLPEPFFVLATQNPIEQEGTYPLPEAQLDRFMFMINITYPDAQQELEIMKRTTVGQMEPVEPIMSGDEVKQVQTAVRDVPIADYVIRYVLDLVRATRVGGGQSAEDELDQPEMVKRYLSWGAGPRAGQYLILAAKAKAILSGQTHVTPDHIQAMIHTVLRHRLIPNFNAEADHVSTDDVIDGVLKIVPVGRTDSRTEKGMDATLKA